MAEERDVVIVGAGFSGLYQLYRLRQEGFDVHLYEAGSGVGGVWNANRYPGARVDSHVPNYEYSIEAVWRDWDWPERFPSGEDLRRYFEHVDTVLDLRRDISLNTRVTSAVFDEASHRWTVTTDRGDQVSTRFVVLCTGFATKPYVPELPGLADFTGEWHHTARWPEASSDLAGRRIGVIGTGASGVQVVQEASKVADHLVVFQRTPVTAIAMQQRRISAEEMAEAKKTYREVFAGRNAPPGSMTDVQRLDIGAFDVTPQERERIFQEAWDRGGFHFWVGTFKDILSDEAANLTAYEFWRDKTRARIDDPAIADFLAPMVPPYPFGTKRPSLEQDYYEAFNQANVTLVDLRSTPIETVTYDGIRTSDNTFDLDLIVFATGFDANTGGLTQIDIIDTDGVSLRDRWADGVDTNLGLSVSKFPNMIIMYGPQSPTAFCNGPTCAEIHGDWIVELFEHMRDRGLTRIESTPEAEQQWTDHVASVASSSLLSTVDSWYMSANIPGKPRQLLNYPATDSYLRALARLRENGYSHFVFAGPGASASF